MMNTTPVRSGRLPRYEPIRANPYLAALLLLTIFTISRAHSYIGPLSAIRPAFLLVGFAGGYALLKPHILNTANLSTTWVPKVFIGLAVLACLSIPFGISMGRAGKFFLEDYWKTLLFTYLLILGMKTAIDLYRLTWAFTIAIGILAYLSLFVFGISKHQGAFGYDANDVGLVMVVGIPMALLSFQASRGWAKVAALGILVLAASTVAASQSRGAFVGLVAIGVAMLVVQNSISLVKRVSFIVAVGLSLLVAAPPGYWDLIRSLQDPQEDYNWSATNGRKALLTRGMGYMLAYPLFGVGINNFPMAEGTISSKAANHVAGTGIRWAAAHNTYIQIGAELGVAGMALWLTLIFRGIYGCIRLKRRLPKPWARGDPEQRVLYFAASALPVSIFGFAVSSFFVSFAYLELFYVVASIMTGLFIFSERKLREERALRSSPRVPPRPASGSLAGRRRLTAQIT